MNRVDTRLQRKTRIRKSISTVSSRARLTVTRSNRYCAAQIITTDGKTVVGVFEKTLKVTGTPIVRAKHVGIAIAKLALEKNIKEVAFDKGPYAYHGRIKALAEGAREGGLQF